MILIENAEEDAASCDAKKIGVAPFLDFWIWKRSDNLDATANISTWNLVGNWKLIFGDHHDLVLAVETVVVV